MEDLQEYIKDITNIEVVLETKTIRILGKMELKKIKKIIEVASIQLMFQKSIEVNQEEELISKILEKCTGKFELTADETK